MTATGEPLPGEPFSEWSALETIRRGLRAAPALRRGLGVTLLLAMLGSVGRVVVPILVQLAIDHGLTGTVDIPTVAGLAAVGAAVTIVATACQRTAVARLGRRSERALYELRVRLFGHIHRLSIADHDEERTGALVGRVTSDVETLTQFFAWGALAWILGGAMILIVVAVMFVYQWLLALVAVVVAAPLLIVLRALQGRLVGAYGRARQSNAEVLTIVSEVVAGNETLRSYGASQRYAEVAAMASRRRSDLYIRASNIGAFLFPAGELFSVLTVVAVVAVGVVIGPGAGLTAGTMVGFVFLTYRFLEPIAQMTEVLEQTQTTVAGLRRVLGVLAIPVGPPEAAHPVEVPSGRVDVAFRDVCFTYPSRSDLDEPPALVDVELTIPAGQQVAVVGETGSGKTTLGRLVARLADPTRGRIELGGVPLTDVANDELRRRLVLVPQEPFLFDGTIEANLLFARPGLRTADLQRTIAQLGLTDWTDSLHDGLATEVGPRGAQLSAGERQLVALVRAALVDPDVLVLDEATSSVDALTEVRLTRALDQLAAGRTVIAIAHRLSTAARADRVLVLDHGHLIEDGAHDDLVRHGGVYGSMYDAWMVATAS